MVILLALALAANAAPDLADVRTHAPDIIIDMRYASENNFVGARIDGYKNAVCLLTPQAAAALTAVQADLSSMGLTLKVHDCYRPQRAVDHFARWAKNDDQSTKEEYYPGVEKSELFALGYIAEKSGHSRGSTVDLTIEGLDMGSPYDFFDPMSHTASKAVPAPARANRLLLKLAMEKRGFQNYEKEWWHYTLADEPYKDQYFDRPVK
ncbi:MAG TPA: M15 family metallopeptidase [Parvularculaceae bacterium]|nr:M15 family metallopeptidase [Parvularculaceae bacterium]HNS88158.1 M15 family metallopeptidase [Parvularculaceae bacterium]